MSQVANLAARLRDIAAELDDAALDVLNRAVADGATARPTEDKSADPGAPGGREGGDAARVAGLTSAHVDEAS